jgi:hypothetical protein
MATVTQEDSGSRVVAAAAAQVYAVPLAEFIPSRKALAASAKAGGDTAAAKEILALRKPTVTAWAMNLACREDSGVIGNLLGLGARMRAAQARLDASVLTSVRGERDASVAAYVERVAEVATAAGAPLSASGRDEVRATAIAALADESASQALASGQLTRALSYSGFGEVDLSGAVGVTTSGSIMSVLRGGKPEGTDGDSDGGTDVDAEPAEPAEPAETTAPVETAEDRARARAAAKARRAAEAELGAAQAEMKAVQAELDAAEREARVARRAVVDAQSRLDAARSALADLPATSG